MRKSLCSWIQGIGIIFLLSLLGCSAVKEKGPLIRIGVDPDWYSADLGRQTSYMNGFTEELLLEIASMIPVRFERLNANWDSLYDGLRKKSYDAVLSALMPYEFNRAQYDFSESFISLGAVLIVPAGSKILGLQDMGGKRIGLIQGDEAAVLLQPYPSVLVSDVYTSTPQLLEAVTAGNVQGALLNRIPAANYLEDLFSGKLQIASSPLTEQGIRLLTIKGLHPKFLSQWNECMNTLEKEGKLSKMRAKWQLGS